MLHNILGFPRKKKCFTTNLIKLTGSEFSFLFFFFLKKKNCRLYSSFSGWNTASTKTYSRIIKKIIKKKKICIILMDCTKSFHISLRASKNIASIIGRLTSRVLFFLSNRKWYLKSLKRNPLFCPLFMTKKNQYQKPT